jgi:hypothetical protein
MKKTVKKPAKPAAAEKETEAAKPPAKTAQAARARQRVEASRKAALQKVVSQIRN